AMVESQLSPQRLPASLRSLASPTLRTETSTFIRTSLSHLFTAIPNRNAVRPTGTKTLREPGRFDLGPGACNSEQLCLEVGRENTRIWMKNKLPHGLSYAIGRDCSARFWLGWMTLNDWSMKSRNVKCLRASGMVRAHSMIRTEKKSLGLKPRSMSCRNGWRICVHDSIRRQRKAPLQEISGRG